MQLLGELAKEHAAIMNMFREFARELGMIYASLRERIRREEQALFAEYRRQVSAEKP